MTGQLESDLRGYLEDAGLLDPIKLGRAEPKPQPEPDADLLFGRLDRQIRIQETRQRLLIAAQGAVFLITAAMIVYNQSLPARLAALLGGVLVLFLTGRPLGRIRSDIVAAGVVLHAIRNSPPEALPKLVEVVYWSRGSGAGPLSIDSPPGDSCLLSRPESTAPEYDDFEIRIQPDGNRPPTILASSSQGSALGVLELPSSVMDQALELAAEMPRVREPDLLSKSRHVFGLAERADPEGVELGRLLFEGLFPKSVRDLYERSVGRVDGSPRGGLRIRIRIHPEHGQLTPLAALPWELLCHPGRRRFVGRGRRNVIVRSPDAESPPDPLPLQLPLRILTVLSGPSDLPPLDLRREKLLIESTWQSHPSVEMECLEHAGLESLRSRLLDSDYHVLHFMGHGGHDETSGAGVLQFEGPGGVSNPVAGSVLAEELEDFARTLRLVVVNACHSAHSRSLGREARPGPFNGLATSLVQRGMTAVLAMQFRVSDPAAIAFSHALYRRLAVGDPIDTAVAEGRRALVRRNPDSLEWATPVLFLRSGNGRLIGV